MSRILTSRRVRGSVLWLGSILTAFVAGRFVAHVCSAPTPRNTVVCAQAVTVFDVDASGWDYSDTCDKRGEVLDDLLLFRAATKSANFKRRQRPLLGTVWKGSWLVKIDTEEGDEVQMAVSYYGGFYKILGQDGIWVVADEWQDRWLEEFLRINQEVFIPQRVNSQSKGGEAVF